MSSALVAESTSKLSQPLFHQCVWRCAAVSPGTVTSPAQLDSLTTEWIPAAVPGTVAAALRDAGQWDMDQPVPLDASDWWYQTTFSVPETSLGHSVVLDFAGLATLAEVWLNGELLLTTDNMFRRYRVEVGSRLQTENTLCLVFRSVTHALQKKRPRPRWKTNLVQHQQLRWIRSSLQGRIPGWSPPVPTIGPWREIRLELTPLRLARKQVLTRLDGTTGIVEFHGEIDIAAGASLDRAQLRVGEVVADLTIIPATSENGTQPTGIHVHGEARIPDAPLWWPHTHGEPHLLECELLLTAGDHEQQVELSPVGFRTLEFQNDDSGFAVNVNGVPLDCRGACWTVSDLFTMTGTAAALRHDLELARDAGANMLRVGGTMTYESDTFYELCDRLGILIWQDFMFANMDYPVDDPQFRVNIDAEATQQLQRLSAHPCVAVYCGNSEVEQQAAMLGLPRELWRNDWFADRLAELCRELHPGTAYLPSTPCGGALPFHPNTGVTHYYGVGAYLRPVEDVRRSDVRFTSECLGFSNIPEPDTVRQIAGATTGGGLPVTHTPAWKRRVPRDSGAGWDFEDVREHYVRELFGVDPVQLRSWNPARYVQLGRVATGEMMSRVFAEWRSTQTRNRGGLVWFYKDLWPAAGWGIIDANGLPKAAYYALKRVWNSRQVTLTDEGLNGLHLHLTNETATPCSGTVEIQLLREPGTTIAQATRSVMMAARSQQRISADELLGSFYDTAYVYRFGPPQHDIVLVTWYDDQQQILSEAWHVLHRRDPQPQGQITVEAVARCVGSHAYEVTLRSTGVLHGVSLSAAGYLPSDNYFLLAPGRDKRVRFRPLPFQQSVPPVFQADLEALNLPSIQSVPLLPLGD